MKSTASIKSHPIHPMLIPFPFAFLTGAWGFRVAAVFSDNEDLKMVSRYLVPTGLAAGLLAAVPGVVDYLGSVPPRSSARQRATQHALFNIGSLTLFALSWFADRKRRRGLPLALETAGTATLCAAGRVAGPLGSAGWMGGTLAYRNQIGVDHRYANAGQWQETRIDGEKADTLEAVSRG